MKKIDYKKLGEWYNNHKIELGFIVVLGIVVLAYGLGDDNKQPWIQRYFDLNEEYKELSQDSSYVSFFGYCVDNNLSTDMCELLLENRPSHKTDYEWIYGVLAVCLGLGWVLHGVGFVFWRYS